MDLKVYSYNNGEGLAKENNLYPEIIKIINEFDIHEFNGKKRKIRSFFDKKLKEKRWKNNLTYDLLEDTTLFLPAYIKNRVGLDIVTDHSIKIGTYFLKYELLSNRHLGYVDFGILISFTRELQKLVNKWYGAKWEGSITFEQLIKYLNVANSIIKIPMLIIGIIA